MRNWFIGTLGAIALSLGAGAFVIIHTAINRAHGTETGDLDAPGFQLASIGYGAMNLLMLSGAVLVILVAIQLFRTRGHRNVR